ncbi:glycosylated lysosomal membrane protein [Centropristis striata]|uniref:glycosylated lysosomal membrane protein n=1 Tax=Centropristis striata TaxID=184440 RepID=UPI0027E09778|nr:glycosylated lysosomal membrane protein [Centropristis striata]
MAAVKKRSSSFMFSPFFLFSLVSFLSLSDAVTRSSNRKVTVALNPGAPSPPRGGELLHVRAEGDNDTLHFLFSSQGAPALLLVHTNTSSSTVTVNWPQFEARNISGSLKVEPESSVLYSTAVVFSRLLEYDDVNDTAEPTFDLFPPYELQNFTWSRLNLSGPTALLCGAAAGPAFAGGSLCVQLSVFGSEGRGQSWPRLLHTADSAQLAVWLDGVLPRATRSRFLLELQTVGGAYPPDRVEVHRSIDDEFTPSIFKVSRWLSVENGSSEVLGFLQWKPVAYRRAAPALEDATPCRHSEPQPRSGAAAAEASGLVLAFYEAPRAFGLNVSFGLAGEPFYNSTKFFSWTVLLGTGDPPVDSFSPLVLAMMAVGLGTPLLLLLVGGVCVCVLKRAAASASAAAYEPIN